MIYKQVFIKSAWAFRMFCSRMDAIVCVYAFSIYNLPYIILACFSFLFFWRSRSRRLFHSFLLSLGLSVDFYCLVTVNVKMPFRKFDIFRGTLEWHKLCRWIQTTTDIQLSSFSLQIFFFLSFVLCGKNRTLHVYCTFIKWSTFVLPLKGALLSPYIVT